MWQQMESLRAVTYWRSLKAFNFPVRIYDAASSLFPSHLYSTSQPWLTVASGASCPSSCGVEERTQNLKSNRAELEDWLCPLLVPNPELETTYPFGRLQRPRDQLWVEDTRYEIIIQGISWYSFQKVSWSESYTQESYFHSTEKMSQHFTLTVSHLGKAAIFSPWFSLSSNPTNFSGVPKWTSDYMPKDQRHCRENALSLHCPTSLHFRSSAS